jgi:hypothetical protein
LSDQLQEAQDHIKELEAEVSALQKQNSSGWGTLCPEVEMLKDPATVPTSSTPYILTKFLKPVY